MFHRAHTGAGIAPDERKIEFGLLESFVVVYINDVEQCMEFVETGIEIDDCEARFEA